MNRLVELPAAMLYNICPAKGEAAVQDTFVKGPGAVHIEV